MYSCTSLGSGVGLVGSAPEIVDRENLMNTFEIVSKVGTRCVFAFTLMLFTIILITMCNSISSSIEMDYTDLGVLKAQGFTVGKIRLVYAVQYMLALFIGAVLGSIAGRLWAKKLIGFILEIAGITNVGTETNLL